LTANQMAREHGMTQAQWIILDRLRGWEDSNLCISESDPLLSIMA
jgi:hypothetical protein